MLISFVIRTYNEASFIGRLMNALQDQEGVAGEREFVIVDSESTDETVRIAQQWPVKLLSVRKQDFDYSRTLNLGIAASSGQLIVILSAHSIPSGTDWLSGMIENFADPRVAGVYCKQAAWPDANWRELRRINNMFGSESLIYDGTQRGTGIIFSNAASCIRRSVWNEHRFTLPAAEDREWAAWAVTHGYRIVYQAGVSVFHSHRESCRQTGQRAINLARAVDLEKGRNRTSLLTLCEAAAWIRRDLPDVMWLENPKPNRLKLAVECFARAFWFVHDFNR